jgi:hypothetical protein
MFNPLDFIPYQQRFWNHTDLGTKAVVVTNSLMIGVATRIFSATRDHANRPFFPKHWGPYEGPTYVAFFSFLLGSAYIGYLSQKSN